MSVELTAEKRPWVPEWLWRIACSWMPLAELLSWPPRCQWPCVLPADSHYYGPEMEYLGRFCEYHGAIAIEDSRGLRGGEA